MSRRRSPTTKAKPKTKAAKSYRTRSPLKSKTTRSRSRSRSPGAPRRPRKNGPSESQQRKQNRVHQCFPVDVKEDIADMTLSRDLTPSEQQILRQILPLYVRWGYRTSPDSGHQRFEMLTHGCCRMLQEYTDIIFCNLQQFDDGRMHIFDSDSINKARDTPDLKQSNADMAEQSTRILEDYFRDPPTINMFLAFAKQDLWAEPHSVGYVAMVMAARAVICIWLRNYRTARDHLAAFVRQFDALVAAAPREPELDDEGDFSGSEYNFDFE